MPNPNSKDAAPQQLDDALNPLNGEVVQVLVDNHRRFIDFLAKRVYSRELAEEILQQSLRKAIENPTDTREEGGIVAWFFRVLRNALIDHYRSLSAEERKHDSFLEALSAEGRTHIAAADEVEAAVCECMNGLLPTLKESYAEVIRRVDLEGESLSAAAKSLGVTENNLTVRLHRARQALKTSLEKACGTCTEHGCLSCTCE